ncbi:shikimate kinase [Tepidibacillus sp. LV47]|uniref:shikimate kinase n=1 Tax=Tepidibacillus sp. LV47 TaxID=3398228 RepID=UPI003AAE3F1A
MINAQHIILIGFMGAGKSTIGKELARQLHYPFMDVDEEIVRQERRTIPEIFKTGGETFFRQIESEVFANLVQNKERSVIATGGGIILLEQNRSILKRHQTILLEASLDTLFKRVSKQQQDRPLLKTDSDMKSKMEVLYNERLLLYHESAKYIIQTDGKSIDTIVEEIRSCIELP